MRVILYMAISADGFIAKDHKHLSKDWTTKEDRHFFVERTKQARVVIMGANTAKSIEKPPITRTQKELRQINERLKKLKYTPPHVRKANPRQIIDHVMTRLKAKLSQEDRQLSQIDTKIERRMAKEKSGAVSKALKSENLELSKIDKGLKKLRGKTNSVVLRSDLEDEEQQLKRIDRMLRK